MKSIKLRLLSALFGVLVLATITVTWAQEDRVGFPKDYESSFRLYHVTNNEERKSPREILINPTGSKVEPGKPFPYGTVIVMLGYRSKVKDGQPLKDEKGLYVKDQLTRIDVMRKEKGYGQVYGDKQSGEWEYNSYRPTGEPNTGDNSRCAACHQDAAATDFVFTAEQLGKK